MPGPTPPDSTDPAVMAARLAAIVDSSFDAIISKDLDGLVRSWNQAAEAMFGYTAAEMVGTSIRRLIPPERQGEEDEILARLRRGERVGHFETERLTKDGRRLEVSITASPIRDGAGRIVGASKIARDISAAKRREREVGRLSRLYAGLSQVNQAIVMSATRDELFGKVCRVLVEFSGFKMAWIGEHDPARRQLLPVALHGDQEDYLRNITVYTDDRPEGRGPTGTAFREDQPFICNDLVNDSVAWPWRDRMQARGLRASAAFPIHCQGRPWGTLSVYADEPFFFRDREIALLREAAGDLSFAMDNFGREERRRQAEHKVRQELDFSAALINSLPGVIYFYDESGKFLRWNDNFERVTGYTGAELATMHPLDFFGGEDRERVAARIGEVFTRGESSVEAGFRAKDGRVTPYYFTGVRTFFEGRPCLIGVGLDISERRQAEAALRESQERLAVIVENLREGLIVADPAGDFLHWNPAALRMLGFTDLAEGRRRQREFDTIFTLHTLDGQPLPPAEWPLARARRGDTYDQVGLQVRRRDSDWARVFSYSGSRVTHADGRALAFVTLRDITERVRGEQERRRLLEAERAAHRQVDQILASVTDAFVTLDRDWRYLYLNDRAAQIFGRRKEDLLGKHIWTEFPEGVGQPFQRAYERAMRERVEIRFEEYYPPYDKWFENRIYPSAEGISIVFQDISERKQAERALREAHEQLEQKVAQRTEELREALDRAEAADRVKSAFLATMSHELRTPLNSIIGFTGIMLQGLAGPLNAEQTKQLGMVRGSARHLLELINDVLDISKIEAGQFEVHAEPFDLRASLERVAGLVRPMAEKKGLALSVTVAPEIGTLVGDRRRTEQILLNLLNNAVKFTDRGSVSVTAEPVPRLQASPEVTPVPGVAVRIADTGVGIRPEDLPKLFQPFRQVDSGLARVHEGTGLGLAICRRLSAMLGGTISVASERSRGSVFTVTLPLQTPPPTA
ncbi:MAG: PAS domain S-box protein [Verrucomicrobia bacterium]|nr:PAS domain S-box protein [Verrucomicrobiota bacterium]